MNRSLKAALLSGLVFPGLGQLVLGAKQRGLSFMLVAATCLGTVIVSATQTAFAILEQLGAEGKPLGIETISEAAARASTTAGTVLFNVAFYGLVLCWLAGIVDAWRTGAKAR